MKLAVSNSYLLKKLDQFGENFDQAVVADQKAQSERMAKTTANGAGAQTQRNDNDRGAAEGVGQFSTDYDASHGKMFVIDNFDLFQGARDMRSDNQNKDHHWTNMICVENRVSANDLPDNEQICPLTDLPNGKVLPSFTDHVNMRSDYIELAARVITTNIPSLQCLWSVVQQHLQHKYSEEMSKISSQVKKMYEY